MNPKIINENTDELFKAILTLKNIDECYAFFDDLCTVPEIKAMAQRYAVAKMMARYIIRLLIRPVQALQP